MASCTLNPFITCINVSHCMWSRSVWLGHALLWISASCSTLPPFFSSQQSTFLRCFFFNRMLLSWFLAVTQNHKEYSWEFCLLHFAIAFTCPAACFPWGSVLRMQKETQQCFRIKEHKGTRCNHANIGTSDGNQICNCVYNHKGVLGRNLMPTRAVFFTEPLGNQGAVLSLSTVPNCVLVSVAFWALRTLPPWAFCAQHCFWNSSCSQDAHKAPRASLVPLVCPLPYFNISVLFPFNSELGHFWAYDSLFESQFPFFFLQLLKILSCNF